MDIMRFITETNIKINVEKKGEKKFFFIQLTCTHYTVYILTATVDLKQIHSLRKINNDTASSVKNGYWCA